MTRDADLKRVVRERMTTTGESYTRAREAVLATPPPAQAAPAAPGQVPPDPFYDKTVRTFFDGDRLRSIPARRRARAVVLVELAQRFEPGREYPEREVVEILRCAHEDHAFLRRELVDYHYLERTDGVYRRTTTAPERAGNLLQELPVSEHARLGWA